MSTIIYNVSFDGSSFNYKLEKNGEEVNFPIKLDVGNTYIFKLTDNLSAHPLYISSSNGSSRVEDKLETTQDKHVITNNVGITNNEESVSIKPLTNSVGDNIFLICGNHASMGGQLVISEICFTKDMVISTIVGNKKIQNLKRGDMIVTKNGIAKLARLIVKKKNCRIKLIKLNKNSIDLNIPDKDLLVTEHHPIFYNGEFTPVKNLVNGNDINIIYQEEENIYNIQFETLETIYVNNTPFISHNPNHFIEPLEEDLYFNKNLFDISKYGKFDNPVL